MTASDTPAAARRAVSWGAHLSDAHLEQVKRIAALARASDYHRRVLVEVGDKIVPFFVLVSADSGASAIRHGTLIVSHRAGQFSGGAT